MSPEDESQPLTPLSPTEVAMCERWVAEREKQTGPLISFRRLLLTLRERTAALVEAQRAYARMAFEENFWHVAADDALTKRDEASNRAETISNSHGRLMAEFSTHQDGSGCRAAEMAGFKRGIERAAQEVLGLCCAWHEKRTEPMACCRLGLQLATDIRALSEPAPPSLQ